MPKKVTPAVSELESHLGFWLRFVSNQVSARFEGELADHDISLAEWVALRALYQSAETRHAALIEALGMTKGAASKIVSKLEAKGLAERRLAGEGGREQALCLTAAGQQLVPRLAALADQNDALFFGHLTETQRQSLMALMQELVSHHRLKRIPTE